MLAKLCLIVLFVLIMAQIVLFVFRQSYFYKNLWIAIEIITIMRYPASRHWPFSLDHFYTVVLNFDVLKLNLFLDCVPNADCVDRKRQKVLLEGSEGLILLVAQDISSLNHHIMWGCALSLIHSMLRLVKCHLEHNIMLKIQLGYKKAD